MDESFVTILFTDLVGSASLFERHGDEAADAVRREHFDVLRRAVAEHGGREVKSTGDGLMVAFPSAVSAVRCAADMQRATSAAEGDLELRVGIEAGEPLGGRRPVRHAGDRRQPAVRPGRRGRDPRLGGRMQDRGPRVSELIQPVGALKLRGTGERVSAAQVRWREARTSAPSASSRSRRARSPSWWPTTTSSCAPASA